MTGQRSLAEIEAKLDLSDVRYWAVRVSPVHILAGLSTHVSWGRIPLLLYCLKRLISRPRTKRPPNGRIEGVPRGKSGVKYTSCVTATDITHARKYININSKSLSQRLAFKFIIPLHSGKRRVLRVRLTELVDGSMHVWARVMNLPLA